MNINHSGGKDEYRPLWRKDEYKPLWWKGEYKPHWMRFT